MKRPKDAVKWCVRKVRGGGPVWTATKRWRRLVTKMASTPLLPLLFLQEWIKVYAGSGKLLNPFLPWAVAATVLWVFADYITDVLSDMADAAQEATDDS